MLCKDFVKIEEKRTPGGFGDKSEWEFNSSVGISMIFLNFRFDEFSRSAENNLPPQGSIRLPRSRR